MSSVLYTYLWINIIYYYFYLFRIKNLEESVKIRSESLVLRRNIATGTTPLNTVLARQLSMPSSHNSDSPSGERSPLPLRLLTSVSWKSSSSLNRINPMNDNLDSIDDLEASDQENEQGNAGDQKKEFIQSEALVKEEEVETGRVSVMHF